MSAPRHAPHPFEGASGLLARVGDTPLIRLRGVEGHVPPDVEVHAKCEWFNPGGSVKDRPALAMVLDAERRGVLQPGATLLDASSGNTGIAYAMIAAARGYRLRLCLPRNASEERRRLLLAYGTEIEWTSPLEGSDGAIRRARELAEADPSLVYLDQYGNDANWRAHYATTAPEIWQQTQGRVTHLITSLGTSGTFVGCARYFRAHGAGVRVVAVQPESPFHGLEGLKHMGSAIVPSIYDADLAETHLGAPTEASYGWVRRLAREGVLCGPSGGAAVWGAVQVAQTLDEGVLVCILPDSGTRYLSERYLWEDR